MDDKEWKEVRDGLTEEKIREMYECQDKVVCSYCGHESRKNDKMGAINHVLNCKKRPELKLLQKAFEVEDRLYAWLKHVTGAADDSVEHYWPTQCDTCKEIKKALDRYDEKEEQ